MTMENLQFEEGVIKHPMDPQRLETLLADLPRWKIISGHPDILSGDFKFENFVDALQFANQVGDLAEQYDHHPEITVEYGITTVRWWTHTAHGIAGNDVFMACETDRLYDA